MNIYTSLKDNLTRTVKQKIINKALYRATFRDEVITIVRDFIFFERKFSLFRNKITEKNYEH